MSRQLISIAQIYPTVYETGQSSILTAEDFSEPLISLQSDEDATSWEAAEEREGDGDGNDISDKADFVPDSQ